MRRYRNSRSGVVARLDDESAGLLNAEWSLVGGSEPAVVDVVAVESVDAEAVTADAMGTIDFTKPATRKPARAKGAKVAEAE